jgi:hypothetical protein
MASLAQDRAVRRWWSPAPLLFLAAGAVVLVATSCSRTSGGMASPPTPTSRTTPTIVSPQPSIPAGQVPRELAFTAPRLGGGTIRGASYAGHDLVVWFWAPW